jgi:hypothetical protein
MRKIKLFEEYIGEIIGKTPKPISEIIDGLRGITKENKELAKSLSGSITKAGNSKIFGLELPDELVSRINTGGYPDGFSFGMDKYGYFIHTHRARSKSKDKISGITVKEMKFIDSTG